MSAAAETAPPAPASKGGKKKLIMIVGLVLVLLLGGGGAALFFKSKAAKAAAEAAAEEGGADAAVEKVDATQAPTFVTLDPFVVNLVDREVDRYAQVGIVLEVENAVFADQMKAYMPAIRNAILMILAHKTSAELLERTGKEELAEDIARETVRPMGIQVAAKTPRASDDAAAPAEAAAKPARKGGVKNPVRRVHFSSFIIQ